METNIHNYEGALNRTLDRIKSSNSIIKENRQTMLRYKEHLKCSNMSDATINRTLYSLIKLDELLKKPFSKAKKDDIKRVVAYLNERQPDGSLLKEESKKKIKMHIRAIYRFIKGIEEKGVYPDEVKWISIAIPKNHKKMPEELLTPEEVKLVIQNCKNQRDKALIATLADSGCRISEIGTMRLKHISFEEYGARLTVDGKTGMRKILVINCVPYLQAWLNLHPDNTNPEAFLWVCSDKSLLSYARLSGILKQAAKDAGIKKRVYPHLLRHSKATNLAPIMSEASMKQYFGWGQDSKMCAVYIHMSGESTDSAILQANGIEVKKEKQVSPMKPMKCIRCSTINEATNKFCRLCGLILNEEEASKIIQEEFERKKENKIIDREKEYAEMFANIRSEIASLKAKMS